MRSNTNTNLHNNQENSTPYTQAATFTVFESFKAPLRKSFTLHDGYITNVTGENDLNLSHGRDFEQSATLPELATFIETLPEKHALCLGLKNPALSGDVCSQALLDAGGTGHTRSKKNYSFSTQQGLVLFDFDDGGLTMDEVVNALRTLLPELQNVGLLALNSSSNGIYAIDSPRNKLKKTGVHLYAIIDNPSMIPKLKDLLRHRGWEQGTARWTDEGYKFKEKHIFDMGVFSPERIVIEQSPKLGTGLARFPRQIKLYEGGVINTAEMSFLVHEDVTALHSMISDAKQIAKAGTAEKLRLNGHSEAEIVKRIDDMDNNVLPHTVQLRGLKTGVNSVGDIVASIQAGDVERFTRDDWFDFDNASNPRFGRNRLFVNADGSIVITSKRSGNYFLQPNPASVDAALDTPYLNGLLRPQTQGCQITMEKTENFDTDTDYQHLDLLQHIADGHICKRMAMLLHEQTFMPPSSLLMVGLGCISGYTHLSNAVCYPDGTALPIGLYVVAEQPSGTGKSNAMNKWLSPFNETLNTAYGKAGADLSGFDITKGKPPEYLDALNVKQRIASKFSCTNATAEGLEKSLLEGDGFFFAASSEQGLFNSLLGFSYRDSPTQNNNDIVLNGYDAGFTRSTRAGRVGFCGRPVGAVTMFAQSGSIDKVIAASQGTGLSERFLCLAEPSPLGMRDHTRPFPIDNDLMADYSAKCSSYATTAASGQAIDFNTLRKLTISDADWQLIAKFKNSLEPKLRKEYAHQTLIGAAAKIEQSIMKIASNLHLMGDSPENEVIDTIHIRSAILIARDLLRAFYKVCAAKGICGQSVEMEVILNMQALQQNNKTLTIDEIIRSRKQVAPFKDMQNKAQSIRATVEEMVIRGLLVEVSKGVFKKG